VFLLLKNLLFVLIAPGTIAVYIPALLARNHAAASGVLLLLAVVLFTIGGCIYLWCLWDFATFGRGTPAPTDPPRKLVVRGLYRYTRNPMYVGILTVLLGWIVLFRASGLWIYALVLGIAFHTLVVLYEERHLKRQFPGEYDRYRAQVGRWLPRARRSGGAS